MSKGIARGLLGLFVLTLPAAPAHAQGQRRPDIVYMDQPAGVEPAVYLAAWPALVPYLARLNSSPRQVEAELQKRAAAADVSDGELNLLAQLEWRHRELDAADATVARAIALKPTQSLNWFQLAMVDFAHLRAASGMWQRWKWQRRTRDAYQRTFELDPRNISARYYLAYSYMNTPSLAGGDLQKALELSDGVIALGQKGFYAVRADVHRLREEFDAANADYDTAIKVKAIKLGGLLDAAEEELGRQQWERARRYLDWAIYCRPDATKAYEGLGDYYAALKDIPHSREAYENAVEKDSANLSAKTKLGRLSAS